MTRESEAIVRDALEALVDMVASRVVARLRARDAIGMHSQAESPLGPRRHCAAVRRRVQKGDPGAQIVGRLFLLSPEALQDELERATRATKKLPQAAETVEDELRQELRLVRGRPPTTGKRRAGREGG